MTGVYFLCLRQLSDRRHRFESVGAARTCVRPEQKLLARYLAYLVFTDGI